MVVVVWEETVVIVVILTLRRVEVTRRHRCCGMVFDSICLMPRVAVVGRGRCGSVVGEVMRWCFIVTYQIANFST